MKNVLLINMDIVDHILNSDMEKVASMTATCSEKSNIAAIPTLEDCATRPDNDFALVILDSSSKFKKFAMYTPELIELNMAILASTQHNMPEELVKVAATNLTANANKHGIEIPVELQAYTSASLGNRYVGLSEINELNFLNKLASFEKTANFKKFAMSGKFPIDTNLQFEKAASWFDTHYNQLSVDEINEFAYNMKNTGKSLTAPLEKCASVDKTQFNQDFYAHIVMRKNMLGEQDTEYKEMYDDLLRRADEIGVEKTAAVLEVIDQEAELTNHYGGRLTHPFLAVFSNSLEKKASANVVEIGGKEITAQMLKKASSDDLSVIVGNGLTRDLKGAEGLDIFNSLPTPIKLEICKIL